MLNYAETASISTIVSVLPLPCTSENEDIPSSPSPPTAAACEPLAALLAHPAFQQGLAFAEEAFLSEFEPAPLTEEEMIEEVEMNLSQRVTAYCNTLCRILGDEPSSYFYNLGYVLGMINQGLTYGQ